MYSAKNVDEVEIVYSILREKFPHKQIEVSFNYNTKIYIIKNTDEKFLNDPEVPVDLKIVCIYGDTDSVFLNYVYNRDNFEKNMKDTFRLAKICGKNITNTVFNRPPIDLEFEKIFNPLVMMAKKNYIGAKYEYEHTPTTITEITNKGVCITRRNYCDYLKECYTKVRDCIIVDGLKGVDEAITEFKKHIIRILKYNVEIDKLIITAALNKDYKNENLPHVQLAKKLRQRKQVVHVGERIPYIFVENKNPRAPKYEKSEDPKYAKEHNLKLDRLFYIEHVSKPVMAFFKIVINDEKEKLDSLKLFVKESLSLCAGKDVDLSDNEESGEN
jgi:DNA polymerase delta subunit 1